MARSGSGELEQNVAYRPRGGIEVYS